MWVSVQKGAGSLSHTRQQPAGASRPGRPLSFVVRGSSPRGGCGSEASSDLALHGAPLAWGPGRAAQACGGVCGGGAPGPDGLASGSARGLSTSPSSLCDRHGSRTCLAAPLRGPWQAPRTAPGTE